MDNGKGKIMVGNGRSDPYGIVEYLKAQYGEDLTTDCLGFQLHHAPDQVTELHVRLVVREPAEATDG